jgi:Flp pilus assembly protein TadD
VNRKLAAVLLLTMLLPATACQSRLMRTVAFWRKPVPVVQGPQPAIGVRAAMLKQTLTQGAADGSFDPRLGDPQVKKLETRMQLDPQNSAMHLELGQLYEKYSIEDMALDQYTRAFNLDAENLAALLGMTRIMRKNPEQLAEVLPRVRAYAESHGDNGLALAALASLLDDTGDLTPAEALYRRALALDSKASYLHNNLGFNLMLQGRLTDAVPQFRKALALNPQSQTARNNLGVALARQGDRQAALRVFIDAGVDRAVAHNNLAVALLEQDRLEESRAELMEALASRNFFEPALENFKLLLEKDQDRQSKPFTAPYKPALPLDWMRTLPNPPGENH